MVLQERIKTGSD